MLLTFLFLISSLIHSIAFSSHLLSCSDFFATMFRISTFVRAKARYLSTAASTLPKVSEIMSWDIMRVEEFAKSVGLDDDDVKLLSANKVNGKSLLNLTEDKLRADGMLRGPASELATAIAELRGTGEYSYL